MLSFIIDDGVSSRGHRENLLKPDYDTVGLGIVLSGRDLWVTMDFAYGWTECGQGQCNVGSDVLEALGWRGHRAEEPVHNAFSSSSLLSEFNWLRTNPKFYADTLREWYLKPMEGNYNTLLKRTFSEGTAAIQSAIDLLDAMEPISTLKNDAHLNKIAQDITQVNQSKLILDIKTA